MEKGLHEEVNRTHTERGHIRGGKYMKKARVYTKR